jgi:SAM-dependent methyltransferase
MHIKDQIVRHHDELSPFYKDAWGVHIHHGYWNTATETKEAAQEQLIRELIDRAKIKNGTHILDIGCGLGGSANFFSKTLGARITGITISPVHVLIGNNLAGQGGKRVIADWFKSSVATPAQERKFLEPIELAMLVPPLEVPCAYMNYIREAGLNVTSTRTSARIYRKRGIWRSSWLESPRCGNRPRRVERNLWLFWTGFPP